MKKELWRQKTNDALASLREAQAELVKVTAEKQVLTTLLESQSNSWWGGGGEGDISPHRVVELEARLAESELEASNHRNRVAEQA
jgi:hypothetical protein